MRPALLMLVVAALAAGPTNAQQSRPAPVARESAAEQLLRGRLGAQDAAGRERGTLRTASNLPSPAPISPARPLAPPSPPGGDAGQCRMACARDYYFCLSGEATAECPSAWGQCRNSCDAPAAPVPGLLLPGA